MDTTIARIAISLDKDHKEITDKLLLHYHTKLRQQITIAALVRLALRELAKANNVK